jgi:hypothetical protein
MTPAVEHLAAQLGIEDPSVVKQYTERPKTAYEHAWEIRDAYEYHEYEDAEWSRWFRTFLHGRAWPHAEGPKAWPADQPAGRAEPGDQTPFRRRPGLPGHRRRDPTGHRRARRAPRRVDRVPPPLPLHREHGRPLSRRHRLPGTAE